MDHDLERLREWIGRTEEARDVIAPAPLRGLAALLDRHPPEPREGEAIAPGAHWLYFLPQARQSELGPDGHARRGGFLPPVELPRRMWAGGRLQFILPLKVGAHVRRVSEVRDVALKEGRTGALVFVAVRHRVFAPEGLALLEEQDLVYREPPAPGETAPPAKPAPATAAWRREIVPDAVMLFRYSALTFNGHRIHYDRAYATGPEGYPGLVVHAPLVATLMLDLWREANPQARLTGFDFRMVRALFDTAPFAVAGVPKAPDEADLWAEGPDGALAASAVARTA